MKRLHSSWQPFEKHRRAWRPLGVVSDFVVEQLPTELEEIRNGSASAEHLAHTCEELVHKVPTNPSGVELDNELALLDLLFLESGIVHSGGVPGENLTNTVDRLAQQQVRLPTLTYEDLIFTNPLEDDARTFTRGDVGLSELHFYRRHHQTEQDLAHCISCCEAVIDRRAGPEHLQNALASFRLVIDWMEELGMKMPKEHFAVFRRYLTTHPIRGLKGPSGVFSASIPTLEILLAGVELPLGYYQYYLEDNSVYLPREGRKSLEVACRRASKGESIVDIVKITADQELRSVAQSLSDAIRLFRGIHYKGVAHQIPEVLAGQMPGTGGETAVREFLLDRMRIRHINEGG